MGNPTAGRVVIAVLTSKRPGDIVTALAALDAQVSGDGRMVQIPVIDNDPLAGAQPTVESLGHDHIRYVHEPKPGTAAARNRALTESHDAPLLIVVDDDETPSEHWLRSLLATYDLTRAAAVVGPVISEFPFEPDAWMRGGRFFDRRRMPTGTVVTAAATNNLLLDLNQLRAMNLSFDERYGLSGGSDTLFTCQIVIAGDRMVWCDEAAVADRVPAERMSRDWVLRRAFQSGDSSSRTNLELSSGLRRSCIRARSTGQGVLRVGGGTTQLGLGLISRNIAHRAHGTRTVARGAGLMARALGHVHSEYSRTPPRETELTR